MLTEYNVIIKEEPIPLTCWRIVHVDFKLFWCHAAPRDRCTNSKLCGQWLFDHRWTDVGQEVGGRDPTHDARISPLLYIYYHLRPDTRRGYSHNTY